MENAKGCYRGSFRFTEYPQESRKIILKEEQKRAVKELISGNDALEILPTGFGKSMAKHGLQTFTRSLPWRAKNAISEDLRPGYLPLKNLSYR